VQGLLRKRQTKIDVKSPSQLIREKQSHLRHPTRSPRPISREKERRGIFRVGKGVVTKWGEKRKRTNKKELKQP